MESAYKWFMENLIPLLTLLGGSTGGGLMMYWLTVKRAKREWYITDKESIVAFLNTQLDAAKKQLEDTVKSLDIKLENERVDCDRKLRVVREEHAEFVSRLKREQLETQDTLLQLRTQLLTLRKATYDLPMASWERSPAGRIVAVNATALRTIFAPLNLSRSDVIGKTYHELWDEETVELLSKLEHSAITSPGRFSVCVGCKLSNVLPACTVCKYIVYPDSQDDVLLYVTYVLPLQSLPGDRSAKPTQERAPDV